MLANLGLISVWDTCLKVEDGVVSLGNFLWAACKGYRDSCVLETLGFWWEELWLPLATAVAIYPAGELLSNWVGSLVYLNLKLMILSLAMALVVSTKQKLCSVGRWGCTRVRYSGMVKKVGKNDRQGQVGSLGDWLLQWKNSCLAGHQKPRLKALMSGTCYTTTYR